MLRDRYEATLAASQQARSELLSERLTLSRKEAQMHEADVEQDDNVADYFANRVTEMEGRVAAAEEKLNALTAIAEEERIEMVTEELEAIIAAYEATFQTLQAQLAALHDQVTRAASLSQRAQELAETLPASLEQQHTAAAQLAARTEEIGEAAWHLEAALASPAPPRTEP